MSLEMTLARGSSERNASETLRIEAVDTEDTKLLSEPAISATHIAFIYAGISIPLT